MKKLIMTLFVVIFAGGIALAQNNVSDIDQINGNQNIATVQQLAGNNATILQNGSYNKADLIQRDYGNNMHEARLRQIGDKNEADVLSQGGVGSNMVDMLQRGNKNETVIAQMHGSNEATVKSRGNHNYAEVAHRSTFSSDAFIDQRGNSNEAKILDQGQGFDSNDGTYSKINQNGNFNMGTINQIGNFHVSLMDQIGNRNMATVTQNSTQNDYSNVYQLGNHNRATVTQR